MSLPHVWGNHTLAQGQRLAVAILPPATCKYYWLANTKNLPIAFFHSFAEWAQALYRKASQSSEIGLVQRPSRCRDPTQNFL